jgi:hypothetical protein
VSEHEKLEYLRRRVADALEREIRSLFTQPRRSAYKFTFAARLPGNDEADVLVTEDSIADVRALLDRSEARS